jgi:hypothetical protein
METSAYHFLGLRVCFSWQYGIHVFCSFGFHFRFRLNSKQRSCGIAFVVRLACLCSERNAEGWRKQFIESYTMAQLLYGFIWFVLKGDFLSVFCCYAAVTVGETALASSQ